MVVAETKRLVISEFTTNDASFYLRLVNTPNWIKYIGDRGIHTIEDAKNRIEESVLLSYVKNGFGSYKLQLKDADLKPIGSCGLYKRDYLNHADIGFAMLPEYENKGFGYESSLEILKLAENEFKQEQVLAITLPSNEPSIKLLEKLGLSFEKTVIPFDDDEELLLFAKTF